MAPPLILATHPDGWHDVAPAVAAQADWTGARRIDVREPEEFTGNLGHVPGAELVPLATVEAAARDWDRAAPVLVICRSGGRSGRAASALRAMGFERVYNLRGGMLAYTDLMLPVEGRG
jgi:rhodanese-related sulfurtransferase